MGESVKSVLFIGDAACGSGFGKASHYILEELKKRCRISVLGINFRGDHRAGPVDYDYPIYAAFAGGDGLGFRRLKEVLDKEKPDLIVLQTNPWNVPIYLKEMHKHGYGETPVVGIIAIEGKNCTGYSLNGLAKAIFWTEFGRREALEGGMKPSIPTAVVPLGVDTELYKPGDKSAARKFLGIDPVKDTDFIVCNVNRNQNRKRIDLTIMYFAEWIHTRSIEDAYLYLHVLPGSSTRVDCDQLASYCRMQDKLILAEPKNMWLGAPEEYVIAAYQACDVGFNTTLGEGWGLTAMECMACQKPYIAGDYAAFGEWGRGAMMLAGITSEGVMPDVQNMIGGVPCKDQMLAFLDEVYLNHRDPSPLDTDWGSLALARAREPRFNWHNVAAQFVKEIEA
jgi:D-inositol-3-phosphate glycosyltransferase